MLTRPYTKHFITCSPNVLYKRLYLCFSPSFLLSSFLEHEYLISVFENRGTIIPITQKQASFFENVIKMIDNEEDILCKKSLTVYLLLRINKLNNLFNEKIKDVPKYIIDALSYIEKNFTDKIVAKQLADECFISRTTLMTNFKKYTGCTLNQYIINLRIKNAVLLLQEGYTEYQAAEKSGFSDTGAFIRAFKKIYKITPKKFMVENKKRL